MTRKISRTASILFALAATFTCAAAQTGTTTRQADAPGRSDDAQDAPSARRASADEDFELNIPERHIVEESFEASTEVAVGGGGESRGVNLRVGVAAGAERIDVWLRGVRGRVRFRASLEQILQRLNSRRAAAPVESR